MMARSTNQLQSEAGYIDARPQSQQIDEFLLRRTAGPYMWVIFVGDDGDTRQALFRNAPKADVKLILWSG
jgi:hypothetical protein